MAFFVFTVMEQIKITLPDGSVREYGHGVTGAEIAASIHPALAREAIGIIANDEPYDLSRPIETDAHVRILKFDSEEGKAIFWHSSAHLMAEAVESLYPGTKFGIGPPVENGFYYDMDIAGGHTLTPDDLEKIEKKMAELAKQDNEFVRVPFPGRKPSPTSQRKGTNSSWNCWRSLRTARLPSTGRGTSRTCAAARTSLPPGESRR